MERGADDGSAKVAWANYSRGVVDLESAYGGVNSDTRSAALALQQYEGAQKSSWGLFPIAAKQAPGSAVKPTMPLSAGIFACVPLVSIDKCLVALSFHFGHDQALLGEGHEEIQARPRIQPSTWACVRSAGRNCGSK